MKYTYEERKTEEFQELLKKYGLQWKSSDIRLENAVKSYRKVGHSKETRYSKEYRRAMIKAAVVYRGKMHINDVDIYAQKMNLSEEQKQVLKLFEDSISFYENESNGKSIIQCELNWSYDVVKEVINKIKEQPEEFDIFNKEYRIKRLFKSRETDKEMSNKVISIICELPDLLSNKKRFLKMSDEVVEFLEKMVYRV